MDNYNWQFRIFMGVRVNAELWFKVSYTQLCSNNTDIAYLTPLTIFLEKLNANSAQINRNFLLLH